MLDKRNVIDDFKGVDTDRIKAICSTKSLPFIVGIESLKGTLNMGVIMRTSNAMGASRVIYWGRKRFDARSAVGTQFYTPFEFRELDYINKLKDQYLVVGVENNIPDCVEYSSFNYPRKTLFMFGSEECGLSDEAKKLCDGFVFIKQLGAVRSLNVAVAASIVIADYVRKYA
jgi:tRNA G18 (ribose-2'-O)-methylase SpoU